MTKKRKIFLNFAKKANIAHKLAEHVERELSPGVYKLKEGFNVKVFVASLHDSQINENHVRFVMANTPDARFVTGKEKEFWKTKNTESTEETETEKEETKTVTISPALEAHVCYHLSDLQDRVAILEKLLHDFGFNVPKIAKDDGSQGN